MSVLFTQKVLRDIYLLFKILMSGSLHRASAHQCITFWNISIVYDLLMITFVHFLSASIPEKSDYKPEYCFTHAAAAKSLQLCPTLCDPIDGSPPGSSVPGILQARTLEWVAISFSNAWKWKVKVKSLSRVQLFTTPWTVAYQAPPSMGFSRQEYWSGLPLPSLITHAGGPQLESFLSLSFLSQST